MSDEESNISKQEIESLKIMYAELLEEQSFVKGLLAGLVTTVVCAAIWGAVTVGTGYQIGYMAVGVGFLVGHSVRLGGRGMTVKFQVLGAVLALLGCVAGNLITFGAMLADGTGTSLAAMLLAIFTSPLLAFELLKETTDPMDFLFYGIAIFQGYHFACYSMSEEQVAKVFQSENEVDHDDEKQMS
jgi:hypothetical protein